MFPIEKQMNLQNLFQYKTEIPFDTQTLETLRNCLNFTHYFRFSLTILTSTSFVPPLSLL
jgi:hypothetical protein